MSHKGAVYPVIMSRSIALGIATLMLLCLLPSASGAEVEELDSGLLLGGIHGMVNESFELNSSFADLPAIAEDYTATWCSNCVDVEEAMEEVALNVNMQIYAVHRNIYDPEDPLGSESVDQWFRDRYGAFTPWKPPVAGFNGMYAISGSKPVGDSLVSDYTEVAQRPNDAGEGLISMTWTPTGANSGTVSWVFEHSTDKKYNVTVWMVEKMAYFPEAEKSRNLLLRVYKKWHKPSRLWGNRAYSDAFASWEAGVIDFAWAGVATGSGAGGGVTCIFSTGGTDTSMAAGSI